MLRPVAMNDPVWLTVVAFGTVMGAVAGSFLATVAIRWPRNLSIVAGRSRCDGCGAPIPAWRLMPLLSYLAQHGRCARCGAGIDIRQPAMEGLCALIGLTALAVSPDPAGAAGAVFGWLLAVLALLDRDHFWLPDRLVLPLASLGLAVGLAGQPPGLHERLIGGAAGWFVLAALAWGYRRARGREGLGQGDAKMLGALGLWLGWRILPWVVLGACGIGLLWLAVRRLRGGTIARTDALPLGSLLAMAAWIGWLVQHTG